jgi:hypothetical protein
MSAGSVYVSGCTIGTMMVDLTWRDAVRAACEPVFVAADVGFEWNDHVSFTDRHPAMLWEAEPVRFASRYPESGIEEAYGDQWPPPCIDYWIYVDPVDMTARLSVEGWYRSDQTIDLTGDGSVDGRLLATKFAQTLGVTPPQP